jgi:hypothetical protein
MHDAYYIDLDDGSGADRHVHRPADQVAVGRTVQAYLTAWVIHAVDAESRTARAVPADAYGRT